MGGQPGTSEGGDCCDLKNPGISQEVWKLLGSQSHPDSPTSWYDLKHPLYPHRSADGWNVKTSPGPVKLIKCVSIWAPLAPANCLPQAGSSHHPNATPSDSVILEAALLCWGRGWGRGLDVMSWQMLLPTQPHSDAPGPSMQTFLFDCDQSFFSCFLFSLITG